MFSPLEIRDAIACSGEVGCGIDLSRGSDAWMLVSSGPSLVA